MAGVHSTPLITASAFAATRIMPDTNRPEYSDDYISGRRSARRPNRRVNVIDWWALVLAFGSCLTNVRVGQANDYYVDATGAGGAFTTIQAAINNVPAGTAANRTNIFIAPGTYVETTGSNANLNINKAFITLIGQGDSSDDVVIQNSVPGLTGATRLQSSANNFLATNLTFRNTLGDNNGQAVALRNSADRTAFENVRFIGFQDTLLVDNRTRQYYRNSYITGDTDFIFGNATAVFEDCFANSSDGSHVTAAETDPETAIGLVFIDCLLTRNGPPGAGANSTDLGRPWHWDQGKIPSVTYINTRMDVHIKPAGWDPWNLSGNPNTNPDGTTRYSEFGSMDVAGNPLPVDSNGVPIGRVAWADPMTAQQAAAYTLTNIFGGPSFWNNNPQLQPEYVGGANGYTDQSSFPAWDPLASLAAIPQLALAGDYNEDGKVSAADFTVWRDHLGASAPAYRLPNETESRSVVDELDFDVWKENYGATRESSGSGAGTSVPEPMTFWIAVLPLLGMLGGPAGRLWGILTR